MIEQLALIKSMILTRAENTSAILPSTSFGEKASHSESCSELLGVKLLDLFMRLDQQTSLSPCSGLLWYNAC